MADSSIEWTDKVWNPVTGCTKVSQGCKNCYAETIAERFFAKQYPPNADGSLRKFTDVRCHFDRLTAPLHWRKPSRIFVNSMSDLFHESVPFEFVDRVFDTIGKCPQHTFQILTKRAERMKEYASGICLDWKNVWLGVSVEDQKTADERIPILLQTPVAVRWISAEPLLGPLQLLWDDGWGGSGEPPLTDGVPTKEQIDGPNGFHFLRHGCSRLDWVVVGAESGNGARPMNEDWVRTIRDQCQEAGVAFFYKQRAENGRAISTPELDGRTWTEYPEISR